ncbi:SMI1/KNR4 family protein [Paenibacillus athensensis]|uniref:SMI1/KNR4 family protein n=1 Tax=Paenibacillus athensensis TaxID=1967502 RepID=A0A4Y8PZJ5_9BACL|nr:SMI1/KNR4 family protein [Paenibacillus athensensis]MCD1261254.1 SMI1/KNR4 family protein [Paenibacillus athensensis]
MPLNEIIGALQRKGIIFEQGLSCLEFEAIESLYELTFPPDLKAFLSTVLPVSNHFVNWRDRDKANINKIKTSLNWPLNGMLFDVEHNSFWYEGWGAKPDHLEAALAMCKAEMSQVPRLIPIYSHRYIPSEPYEIGNPIFSVYQTDIIYYGDNLARYLMIEFGLASYDDICFESIKPIRFWSDMVG